MYVLLIFSFCPKGKGNGDWMATSPFSLKRCGGDGWPPLPYEVEGDRDSHLYIRSKKDEDGVGSGNLYIQSKVGRGMECKPLHCL